MPTHENEVSDSTDWLSTPLSALAALESALRCQVCKDLYKTPMITSCSHTFCSICIRRALSNDGKCPMCRAPDQEMKLRSNWSLEDTVEAFTKARPATLDLARNGCSNVAGKRKAAQELPVSQDAPEAKRTRTSARLSKNRSTPVVPDVPNVPEKGDDVSEIPDDDDDCVPEPDDGLVSCPVCQNRMKEWQVFKHLESCPGESSTPKKKSGQSSVASPFRMRQQDKTLERLPAINYSMFKENALRKKMADLGISNQGPRHLVERRHREWMTIWNSNCDAARPKKRHELLQDLDMWERTQGGRAPQTGKAVQNAAMIKAKDFDGSAWASKHDTSFKDLIAAAKKSREDATKKQEDARAEEGEKKVEQEKPMQEQPLPFIANSKTSMNPSMDLASTPPTLTPAAVHYSSQQQTDGASRAEQRQTHSLPTHAPSLAHMPLPGHLISQDHSPSSMPAPLDSIHHGWNSNTAPLSNNTPTHEAGHGDLGSAPE